MKNDTSKATDPVEDVKNNVEDVNKEVPKKEDAAVESKTSIVTEREKSFTMLYIVPKSCPVPHAGVSPCTVPT